MNLHIFRCKYKQIYNRKIKHDGLKAYATFFSKKNPNQRISLFFVLCFIKSTNIGICAENLKKQKTLNENYKSY